MDDAFLVLTTVIMEESGAAYMIVFKDTAVTLAWRERGREGGEIVM